MVATAERAWRAEEDIVDALAAIASAGADHLPDDKRHKLETLSGIHSNAAGLKRWLDQQHQHPHPH